MTGERDDATITWRTLLTETDALIADRTHARWLCETATSTSPAEFLELLDEPATQRAVAHLDAMVARVRAGEPIQYVLGSWAFRHVDLAVDRRVLIPRPETEEVAGAAIELAVAAGPIRHVADLGTGSGAIGLALADELPVDGTTVWMTDVSTDALAVARANLAGVGRGAQNVRLAAGSWCDALPTTPLFDVIVSNPPYVATGSADIEIAVSEWEPHGALFAGVDGLDDIREIVTCVPTHLRPGGSLVVEHGHDQGPAVASLFESAGLVSVETRRDHAGHDRFTVGSMPVELFETDSPLGQVSVRRMRNDIDDYATVLRWLTTPDVLEWWEGRDKRFDLATVLAEYGPGGVAESDETEPAIIELDGASVGYLQLFELDDSEDAAEFELDPTASGDPLGGAGIWTLDLYIGEPSLYGSGIGRAVVRAAADFLLDEYGARDVVILPYVDNARAIASYRAGGFVGDHIVRAHEMHEGVVRDAVRLHYRR